MKSVLRLFCSFVFTLIICDISQAKADNVTVDMPGVHVSNGAAGTSVIAPGVAIQTPAVPQQTPQPYAAPSYVPAQAVVRPASAVASSYANANLSGMDFSNQNLAGADFSNATLSSANFGGANLVSAHFTNANLTGVNFTGAQLMGADFSNATLAGANLTNADFSSANLTNANLDHALASGTRFAGAVLVNVNMGLLIRQAPVAVAAPLSRPVFVNAGAISTALNAPQRKIDLTINFDFNSDKVTPDSMKQVDQIAAALKDPSLAHARIMIEGHTDNVGSDTYNKDLSYRRAMRVQRLLIDQYGVNAARLSAQGFGKTRPIASNDNDLGRAMNRRVTLVNLGG